MRSRCFGSMLAWILNTNPENGASAGCTTRVPASRGCGGRDDARPGIARLRRRSPFDQRLQDFLHAEIVDARAEEHRRLTSGQEFGEVERRAGVPDQVDVMPQCDDLVRKELVQPRIGKTLDALAVLRVGDALLARGETQQA